MSARRNKSKSSKATKGKELTPVVDQVMRKSSSDESMAVSSSLNTSIPRTPITSRTPVSSRMAMLEDGDEELELNLLGDQERREARQGLEQEEEAEELTEHAKRPISSKDKRAMVLLCVLCG